MNKDLQAVWSSRSDDWSTPNEIYNYLYDRHGIKPGHWFDPCPLGAIDQGYDGLKAEWNAYSVYINPPYSNIKGFVEKAIKHHSSLDPEDVTIVFLIPARTDTKYYKLLFEYGANFIFIEGRLKFGNSKHSSTFPSVLVELTGQKNTLEYLTKNARLRFGGKYYEI